MKFVVCLLLVVGGRGWVCLPFVNVERLLYPKPYTQNPPNQNLISYTQNPQNPKTQAIKFKAQLTWNMFPDFDTDDNSKNEIDATPISSHQRNASTNLFHP